MADKFEDVDSYLNSLDEQKRPHLTRLRAVIRKAVPEAAETIKYGMAYYEYKGLLCAFAAQKNYFSFYLLNGEIVARHRDELKGLKVGKGCIRFKDITDLPEGVIVKLLKESASANRKTYNDHC